MLFISEPTQALLYIHDSQSTLIPQEQSIINKVHATQYRTQRFTGLNL